MPDITMCDNRECVIRAECFRFRAIPGTMQSWSKFVGGATCQYYVPLYAGRPVRPLSECDDSPC